MLLRSNLTRLRMSTPALGRMCRLVSLPLFIVALVLSTHVSAAAARLPDHTVLHAPKTGVAEGATGAVAVGVSVGVEVIVAVHVAVAVSDGVGVCVVVAV
jgi:hypothetical protein